MPLADMTDPCGTKSSVQYFIIMTISSVTVVGPRYPLKFLMAGATDFAHTRMDHYYLKWLINKCSAFQLFNPSSWILQLFSEFFMSILPV
jgi:hypothetical protein